MMLMARVPTHLPTYIHTYQLHQCQKDQRTAEHHHSKSAPFSTIIILPTYLPTYIPTYTHTVAHSKALVQLYLSTYLPTYIHTYQLYQCQKNQRTAEHHHSKRSPFIKVVLSREVAVGR